MDVNGPFFLVGSERSGTTLLRLMLSHHPEIECAPEFEFLVEPMTDGPRWPDLEAYREWLSTNRIFVPHGLEMDESLDYPELAQSFVRQYCERSGKPIHGATCHKHFDRLLRIWPGARFVHLLRDGRDVARSCIGMGWSGNVWTGAQRWIDAEEIWEDLVTKVPAGRRFELRYEDLIARPEEELGRLCGFLGTTYDESMLDYDQASSYSRPDASLVEQWRKKLDERELALLEARIGPLLGARGYPPSGVAPASVGALTKLALWWDDRLTRFRFRRARYGLPRMLNMRLSRTLGLRSWQRRLTLEQNEIDNRYIK